MKNYLIVFFCLCALHRAMGQVEVIKFKKLPFVHARFPGTNDAMSRYLDNSVREKLAACLNTNDRVVFTAVVDVDTSGRIEKVNLEKGYSSRCDSIYVSAIRKMPLWIPATNEAGKNCRDQRFVSYNIYKR